MYMVCSLLTNRSESRASVIPCKSLRNAICWFRNCVLLHRGQRSGELEPIPRRECDGVVSEVTLPLELGPRQPSLVEGQPARRRLVAAGCVGRQIFVTDGRNRRAGETRSEESGARRGRQVRRTVADLRRRIAAECDVPLESAVPGCATGKTLWEKTARDGRPTIPIHANNTYASETPATDGERVVAYFGMAGVYCYDCRRQSAVEQRSWHASHAVRLGHRKLADSVRRQSLRPMRQR